MIMVGNKNMWTCKDIIFEYDFVVSGNRRMIPNLCSFAYFDQAIGIASVNM